MTSLEVSVSGKVIETTQTLDHLNKESRDVKKDVGVFSAIKHLVTDSQLEARAASIHAHIKTFTAHTSGFVDHLNGYLQRTEKVERGFQAHIATAFAKVEREFTEIKHVAQGVHNAGADASNAVSMATLQLQQNPSATAPPASRRNMSEYRARLWRPSKAMQC